MYYSMIRIKTYYARRDVYSLFETKSGSYINTWICPLLSVMYLYFITLIVSFYAPSTHSCGAMTRTNTLPITSIFEYIIMK
jgi:hypothetical protein